jgi:hypothetical protein
MQSFVVNGKSYSSIEEMPQDVRKTYELAMGAFADRNQNGVPDIFEGGQKSGDNAVQGSPIVFTSAKIIVDGKVYERVEDLPPEAKRKYEIGLEKMSRAMGDADGNGIPDLLEGKL